MADLTKILKDGTETGATVADKINLSFTKIDTTDDNLQVLYNRTDGIEQSTPAGKLDIAKPMRLTGAAQVPPSTPNNEFATFAAVHTLMTTPRQEYALEGAAPKMEMKVTSPSGVGAEMEVLFGTTQVASMQWNKINQEFAFNLSDKDTGANKAQFSIKPDGNAYVGSKRVVTTEDRTYDFVKISSEIVVAGTTWEDAMILNTPSRVPGVYELKWEILYTLNTVTKSAKFRYSIDDGATWAVLTREIKDKTNDNTIQIWFPYEITAAQEFKLKVQVAKEDAASVMKCKFGSLVAHRVK